MSVKIELRDVAKRYRLEWVLRHVTLTLSAGRRYALTGPNGSGKSTLMKILSGHLTPSRGQRRYQLQTEPIDIAEVYRHLSYAAPYIDLIEEFTLWEAIRFHSRFKPMHPTLRTEDIIQLLNFRKSKNKEIRHFSSGMKQRLKLALAICSDTPLLLLDEPTTNLDRQGVNWYLSLMRKYALSEARLVVVASNVEEDYAFCEEEIEVMNFKKKR